MENKKIDEQRNLRGNELTKEQFSDVYMAGTSDGIHQLEKGTIKVDNEPFQE